VKILQPKHWATPRGYANGIAAHGTIVSVAGQVGWNEHGQFESDDFVEQARQALANIVAVLAEADAKPEHIVRLTWYILDRSEYLAAAPRLGAVYRTLLGRHFPAMSAVQVVALIEERARLEIEATAVVPD
jgi:enamine deaminase RidA (YjgF/YER057c/UK114 family)